VTLAERLATECPDLMAAIDRYVKAVKDEAAPSDTTEVTRVKLARRRDDADAVLCVEIGKLLDRIRTTPAG